ncbi:MAG: pyruvate:ferredoxin (flavodoxin) oxidoreductase, partial [Eggerthellaceae bacterium]|nr:pyruvate:ferredoxin (flavodoxin) oxidoreductase [Eggerthellaceae bacterium]
MAKISAAIDGMTAAAYAAYSLSDSVVIFPITPASRMSETKEKWSSEGRLNFFNQTVDVKEMQSEKGVSGTLHGLLDGGALGTTITDSQGLMLMIPNMYKISGENLPGVFHVTTRSLSAHALSIFGDHQDVMAVRQTGVAMLGSASVQECMDLSWVAHLSAIDGSLPFVHFFDGFRTSDEYDTIDIIDSNDMLALVNQDAIKRFRERAMEPKRPNIRGPAQNHDIYFQNMAAANYFYDALPDIVQTNMDKLASVCGRQYHLFDYVGAPDAEYVIASMASSTDVIEETVNYLNQKGYKVGLVKVRLYRPFAAERFMDAIPSTVKVISALDRTKEPGSQGEPLYQDVAMAVMNSGRDIKVCGGRYGLSSKDFTPTMVKAVYDNMAEANPKRRFTVGITDDITHTSLELGPTIHTLPGKMTQCIFYGFASDGTVGANHVAAHIVGTYADKYAQEYSWFDSRKAGGVTISYFRIGDAPIHSPYLIDESDYVACNKDIYVRRGYGMTGTLKDGGTFVLNCAWDTVEELEEHLEPELKQQIASKKLNFYVINASQLAADLGLGARINMIMETVFFKLSGVMDFDEALSHLKDMIATLYASKGKDVVERDIQAVDQACSLLKKIDYPARWADIEVEEKVVNTDREKVGDSAAEVEIPVRLDKSEYVEQVFWPLEHYRGNELPVSKFDPAGIVPPGTSALEKRTVAFEIPEWDVTKCIQCYQCSFICPHAAIRPYVAEDDELKMAPETYQTKKATFKPVKGLNFRIQVYPEDCVGCGSCAVNCPAPGKALVMKPLATQLETQKANLEFAQANISIKDDMAPATTVMGTQLQQPLLEFSGCCAGCGETPNVKLLTQLFGDRLIMSDATG